MEDPQGGGSVSLSLPASLGPVPKPRCCLGRFPGLMLRCGAGSLESPARPWTLEPAPEESRSPESWMGGKAGRCVGGHFRVRRPRDPLMNPPTPSTSWPNPHQTGDCYVCPWGWPGLSQPQGSGTQSSPPPPLRFGGGSGTGGDRVRLLCLCEPVCLCICGLGVFLCDSQA